MDFKNARWKPEINTHFHLGCVEPLASIYTYHRHTQWRCDHLRNFKRHLSK